jgi:hypothetical protein
MRSFSVFSPRASRRTLSMANLNIPTSNHSLSCVRVHIIRVTKLVLHHVPPTVIWWQTWFHPVWYRKYQNYFYPVQILQSRRFISIPTYKMHPAGAIFEFAVSPKYYLHYKYSACKPTTHNTHNKTTKMGHCRPTLQQLCPLSP